MFSFDELRNDFHSSILITTKACNMYFVSTEECLLELYPYNVCTGHVVQTRRLVSVIVNDYQRGIMPDLGCAWQAEL